MLFYSPMCCFYTDNHLLLVTNAVQTCPAVQDPHKKRSVTIYILEVNLCNFYSAIKTQTFLGSLTAICFNFRSFTVNLKHSELIIHVCSYSQSGRRTHLHAHKDTRECKCAA